MEDEPKKCWSWFGKRLARLLDTQFILGALILIAWLYFLLKPLKLLGTISFDDLDKAKEQMALILTLTAGISALFTTALGFVLGYFFGKQGIESAEMRASYALEERKEAEKAKAEAEEARAENERLKQVYSSSWEQMKKVVDKSKEEIKLAKKQYRDIRDRILEFKK